MSATKLRRFNQYDQNFIKGNVNKLATAVVIQSSRSPWLAQVLVVTNQGIGKKRLCVNQFQTINIFINLDAYFLTCINDLVNKLANYKVFSTFDLKSACYQTAIEESEKLYTAFEADWKLRELNRIPFGVTNGVP